MAKDKESRLLTQQHGLSPETVKDLQSAKKIRPAVKNVEDPSRAIVLGGVGGVMAGLAAATGIAASGAFDKPHPEYPDFPENVAAQQVTGDPATDALTPREAIEKYQTAVREEYRRREQIGHDIDVSNYHRGKHEHGLMMFASVPIGAAAGGMLVAAKDKRRRRLLVEEDEPLRGKAQKNTFFYHVAAALTGHYELGDLIFQAAKKSFEGPVDTADLSQEEIDQVGLLRELMKHFQHEPVKPTNFAAALDACAEKIPLNKDDFLKAMQSAYRVALDSHTKEGPAR